MTVSTNLQVVVFAAGKGSRMPELLSGKPKCLLPIGPKPLIWYTLYKVQNMGFEECIVIVLDSQELEIQEAVDKCGLSISVKLHAIPHDQDYGTADSLRSIYELIHSDVLILPCDLLTDIHLESIFMKFKEESASLVSLYLQPQSYKNLILPGPKAKNKQERRMIMMHGKNQRLVYLASTSDFEGEFDFTHATSMKFPKPILYTTLVDSHVFVMKKWVLDYLNSLKSVSTLQGEFLPHLIKKQLVSLEQSDDIFKYSNTQGNSFLRHLEDPVRCFACVAKEQDIAVRVNTLASFYFMNWKLAEFWNKLAPNETLVLRNPNAEIKSTQVDEKCIVWENAKLGEKTAFKQSIIGPNVEVNSFSRIFNCILMKNVVIKERVALENCIIAENSVIESGVQLNSCIVGCNQIIPEESKHKNEILVPSDRSLE